MRSPMRTRREGKAPRPFDLLLGVAAVAVLLWAGAGVRAELGKDRLPLENLVPADTVAFLTFPDMGKAREGFETTALHKIWEDAEVQHAVDVLLGNVEKYREEFEQGFLEETGVELDAALEIFDGQVSVALISLPGPEDRTPMPKAAFALDFGDHREQVEKLLTWGRKFLLENESGLEEITWDAEGTTVNAIGDEDMTLHWVLAGPTLLIANDKSVMEGMLARARDPSLDSLGKNETFGKVLEEVTPEGAAAFLLYANIPVALAQGRALMGEDEEFQAQIDTILEATGARGLEALGFSVSFTDEGVRDRLYLHAPGPRTGAMRMLSPKVTAMPSLPLVPADAVAFSAMRVDLALAWDRALEMIQKIEPEMWEEINGEIERFEKDAGVMIRTDLLGSLGEEVCAWSAFPEGGGVLPYSVTTVALKDPVVFEATLERLYDALGMERREIEWMGHTLRYFVARLPEQEEAMPGHEEDGMMGGGMEVFPGFGGPEMIMMQLTSFSSYFIDGSTLYTSSLVQTLKDVIRKRGKKRETLAESPEFKELMARLPAEPGVVLYYDLRSTFYLIYNSILPFLQVGEIFLRRGLNVPFETAALPTAEAIGRHLAPSITGVVDRPGGILLTSYSSTGVTAAAFLGVATAAIGAAVAIPSLGGARDQANEASAIASLKTIVTGQFQFQNAVGVDQNANGVGEFGFLQELAGTSPCRTDGGLDGPTYAAAPFIPQILGLVDAEGRAMKNGYYFKLFLPGEQEAIAAGMQLPVGEAALAPLQETTFVAYAWPVEWGQGGRQTFFVDATGQIYATDAMYSGDFAPEPSAAFSPESQNPRNLQGMAGMGEGLDGNFWFPIG